MLSKIQSGSQCIPAKGELDSKGSAKGYAVESRPELFSTATPAALAAIDSHGAGGAGLLRHRRYAGA